MVAALPDCLLSISSIVHPIEPTDFFQNNDLTG